MKTPIVDAMNKETNSPVPAVPKPDSTAAAILAAAREAFIDKGLEATTIAAVARRAGVSRQTVYNHYPNIRFLAASVLTQELLQVLSLFEPAPDSVDELIECLISASNYVRDSTFVEALVRNDPQVLITYQYQRLGTSQLYLIDTLSTIIERLQNKAAQGEHPPLRDAAPRTIATFLLTTVQMRALSRHALRQVADDDTWDNELQALLKGYLYS